MTRRTFLGVAAVAAAGGAALSWWQNHRALPSPGAPLAASDADAAAAVWALRLPQPGGGELALASLRGRPLLLNFWATWCPPCVKEMPELDRFARAQGGLGAAGWQVVGVAIDKLEAVQAFLKHTPVRYPIGLADYAATDLTRRLGNSAGGLPFTVAFDSAGRLTQRKLGSTSHAELNEWASAGRPTPAN